MTRYAIKQAVKLRDEFRCRECGMTADEHLAAFGKTLDVHRVVPGSEYSVDGCLTLCRNCHGPKAKSKKGTGSDHLRYIGIPIPLWNDIFVLAREEDRSVNWLARRLLRMGLDEYKETLEDK